MAIVERRELERVVRLLFAHALKTSGEVLAFQLVGSIALVGTVFRCPRETTRPVGLQQTEIVFAAKGEVHRLLQFKSGILMVGRSRLRLHHHRLLRGLSVQFLIRDAIAIFPVAPAVVHSLEENLVLRVEEIVEGKRIALTLAGDIILPHLRLLQCNRLVVVFHVFKLRIVRPSRCILVRSRCHHAEAVVEEAVAEGGTQIPCRFFADP